ncbi:MAG: NTP transferase domain-containing protein [Anaerovoracaceae bacterium]
MKYDIGAVVLAAGKNQISNIPMLRQELDTLREADVHLVAVVTGYDQETVRHQLVHRKTLFVENSDYAETGMLESVKLGLQKLQGECERVIIVPADIPSFHVETVHQVTATDGQLVIPTFEGQRGHPICLDMRCADIVCAYQGERGMRGLIDSGQLQIVETEVDDPGILMEADSLSAYKETVQYREEKLQATPLQASVEVGIARQEVFFGEGLAQLLEEIENCHSLNQSCKNLNVSYSHGWKSIKRAEKQLCYPLIEKQTGGRRGGGSGLTQEGVELVRRYRKMQKQIRRYAQKAYRRIFEPEEK